MREDNKNSYSIQAAFGLAAAELDKAEQLEQAIMSSLENGEQIDTEALTDYAKVINSYCNALDLMENYSKEQQQYEKVINLLSKYSESHPDQFNITMITYIKYATVLWKQKKFKKSSEALKMALSFLLTNMDNIDLDKIDTTLLTNQISQI